jgi:hypothetical protein
VNRLGTVFSTLVNVTGATQQLTLQSFLDQFGPCSGQAGADGETFGGGGDMIELKILNCTAAHTAVAKHLDQLGTSGSSPGLDVSTQILCTCH